MNLLRNNNNTGNSSLIAQALSWYISSITNQSTPLNDTFTLKPNEIDSFLSNIKLTNLTINTKDSFLMAFQPNQGGNVTVGGASFIRGTGGQIIQTQNLVNTINANTSAAAFIDPQSLVDATNLNMLIIDQASTYKNLNTSNGYNLASSVIVASLSRNSSSTLNPTNISLYFRVLDQYRPPVTATYICAFYDLNNSSWNSFGCVAPQFNSNLNLYQCSCNHLSTFSLLWQQSIIPCNSSSLVQLPNGTCVSNSEGQVFLQNLIL